MTVRMLARPAAGILMALLLVACGSGVAAQGQQAAAATAAPATASPATAEDSRIPDAFLGTWTADITEGTASYGTWSLRITPYDMELLNPIAGSEDEYFSLNPKTTSETGVSMWEDPDCEAAEYRWSIDGGLLTFEAVEDTCGDRKAVLTTTSWQQAP